METTLIEPWVLAAVAGPVIAVVTGLLTRVEAPPSVRALVSLGLTVFTATVTELVDRGVAFSLASAVALFGKIYLAHVVAYHGALKPLGGGLAPGARSTEGVIG